MYVVSCQVAPVVATGAVGLIVRTFPETVCNPFTLLIQSRAWQRSAFYVPTWHLNKNPSAHHRVSDGLSFMPLSSLPFSVLHTSGRPCFLSFLSSQYSQSFSYKDFSECFPLWCEEQPNGAEGIFNTVSSFIETHIVVRSLPSSIPIQLKLPSLSPSPLSPWRPPPFHSSILPFWDGNTRLTQTSCSSNTMSKKT